MVALRSRVRIDITTGIPAGNHVRFPPGSRTSYTARVPTGVSGWEASHQLNLALDLRQTSDGRTAKAVVLSLRPYLVGAACVQ